MPQRRVLRALERVVDLLQEVSGLVLIGGPGRVEVLQRIELHDLILALAFGARRTVGRIEGAGLLALYVIFVVVAITASF